MQSRHRSHIGRGHRYAVGESKEVSGDREAGARGHRYAVGESKEVSGDREAGAETTSD